MGDSPSTQTASDDDDDDYYYYFVSNSPLVSEMVWERQNTIIRCSEISIYGTL